MNTARTIRRAASAYLVHFFGGGLLEESRYVVETYETRRRAKSTHSAPTRMALGGANGARPWVRAAWKKSQRPTRNAANRRGGAPGLPGPQSAIFRTIGDLPHRPTQEFLGPSAADARA